MDTTATIITTIISLATVVGIVSKFISTQTKLEVQLARILTDLTEINIKLDKRDDEIRLIHDRLTKLEMEHHQVVHKKQVKGD